MKSVNKKIKIKQEPGNTLRCWTTWQGNLSWKAKKIKELIVDKIFSVFFLTVISLEKCNLKWTTESFVKSVLLFYSPHKPHFQEIKISEAFNIPSLFSFVWSIIFNNVAIRSFLFSLSSINIASPLFIRNHLNSFHSLEVTNILVLFTHVIFSRIWNQFSKTSLSWQYNSSTWIFWSYSDHFLSWGYSLPNKGFLIQIKKYSILPFISVPVLFLTIFCVPWIFLMWPIIALHNFISFVALSHIFLLLLLTHVLPSICTTLESCS